MNPLVNQKTSIDYMKNYCKHCGGSIEQTGSLWIHSEHWAFGCEANKTNMRVINRTGPVAEPRTKSDGFISLFDKLNGTKSAEN